MVSQGTGTQPKTVSWLLIIHPSIHPIHPSWCGDGCPFSLCKCTNQWGWWESQVGNKGLILETQLCADPRVPRATCWLGLPLYRLGACFHTSSISQPKKRWGFDHICFDLKFVLWVPNLVICECRVLVCAYACMGVLFCILFWLVKHAWVHLLPRATPAWFSHMSWIWLLHLIIICLILTEFSNKDFWMCKLWVQQLVL